MKILLFGSIAAGKTTIANKILKKYSEFELLGIDNFRKEFGDFTMQGEDRAKNEFLKAIKKVKNQIIEASGLGKLGYDIYDKLTEYNEPILIIVLHISENEIYKRIQNRTWDIPFPGKQSKLNDIILSINFGVKFGKIPLMWSELPQATILQIENSNFKTQKFIIQTIQNYINSTTNETI